MTGVKNDAFLSFFQNPIFREKFFMPRVLEEIWHHTDFIYNTSNKGPIFIYRNKWDF